jgi:predicted RNase H-like nuclease
VAVIDGDRQILDAGWTNDVEQTISWAASAAGEGDAVLFADGPLVVRDVPGQRVCQAQAGQRCGRWSAPLRRMLIRPRLAGVQFLRLAALSGSR